MNGIGLNFGSPTSGQGIDVSSMVSQIMAGYQAVETPWRSQLADLAAQDAAFSTLGSDLSSLSTAFGALTNFEGPLASMEGSSSAPNILALTSAATTAVAGSHTITVTSLAQTSAWSTSQTLISASDTLTGSVSIQVGSGAAQNFTIDSTDNTLPLLAAAINNAGIGVTANVVTESGGSYLSLVSGTSGSAGGLTITGSVADQTTGGTALNFTQAQPGLDAQLTVDGVAMTSPSNTVTNAIPGVTYQLLEANPSTPVQVEITNNTSSVTSTVQSFVSSYNTLVQDLNKQEGANASGSPEPLFGNGDVALMQEDLGQAINTTVSGSGIAGFAALGITVNNDGTLALNSDTLNTALDQNYQNVVSFFQGVNSIGQQFSNVLSSFSASSPTGVLAQALNSNASVEGTLNQNIANENKIIAAQQTRITAQLNQANEALQSIPTRLSEVNEIYSAITGYSQVQG